MDPGNHSRDVGAADMRLLDPWLASRPDRRELGRRVDGRTDAGNAGARYPLGRKHLVTWPRRSSILPFGDRLALAKLRLCS